MNAFRLFENDNVEDVKLGLNVIKSLGLQKEFEEKMGISFDNYEDIFNNLVLVLNQDKYMENSVRGLLQIKLNLSNVNRYFIEEVLITHPQLISYFNVSKLNYSNIITILSSQQQLKPYFNKNGIK